MQMSPRSLLLCYLGVKNRTRTKKATFQNKLRSSCSLVGRVKVPPPPTRRVKSPWHIKVRATCSQHYLEKFSAAYNFLVAVLGITPVLQVLGENLCVHHKAFGVAIYRQCTSCKSQFNTPSCIPRHAQHSFNEL